MPDTSTYDIRLSIGYTYRRPAGTSRTLLRIQPLSIPGQQVLAGLVSSEPRASFRQDGHDFFGNPMVFLAHDDQIAAITFRFEGRVLRLGPEGGLDLSCAPDGLGAEIAAETSIAPDSPHHFLGVSPRVAQDPEIAAFARETAAGAPSVLAAVEAVLHRLHREFTFDPTATEVTTTPSDAFRLRRGVCQDISHVAITALRSIGVPAGYVSGYLRTIPPPGEPRLEGADAMHAWVRVWCGARMGWLDFDPTNDIRGGADHIVVAIGRDYSDVAPVKGSLRSSGQHESEHSVDVVPV